ncbi:MAG TPA: hypothetical protein VMH37_08795 [Candidatus Binataceae bacterium]|nr:hypothetical protein [Candidatus Binataceae bacterium]
MEQPKRNLLLTIFAVLFGIAAIQDILKPFHLEGPNTGLVFFGTRLSGTANVVMSIVLFAFLLSYAVGVWRMSKYALPLGLFYAVYVLINLVVFSVRYSDQDNGPLAFLVVFIAGAVAIPWGAVLILWRHRAQLV